MGDKNDNNKIVHEHDKSYKYFLSDSRSFLELLQGFVKEPWVKDISENDLELVNKSFILRDYEEREADIVYKLKHKGKECYFYVLLELQSTVDYTMPFRLLIYMTELWKQLNNNTDIDKRERKGYRLPAIIPITLYNGSPAWTANMSYRKMQEGYELFGEHLVDFRYILFDVNRYKDEELLKIGNMMAAVFAMDKDEEIKILISKLKSL